MNHHVKIMAIKIMDSNGNGLLSNLINGIEYAIAMGAHMISNSFGVSNVMEYSNSFDRLMKIMEEKEILYVVAAGNKGIFIYLFIYSIVKFWLYFFLMKIK